MTIRIEDHCGLFGISCNDFSYSISGLIYPGLMALQHRGQSYAGIATSDCNGKILSYKDRGLVSKALNKRVLKGFAGNVGMGHVCREDDSIDTIEDAQPYHIKSEACEFAISFNGCITNKKQVKKRLEGIGKILISETDIELIATLLESLCRFSNDMVGSLTDMMKILKGSYCILIIESNGRLHALRDPLGYKPLCHGTLRMNNKRFNIVASESCCLDALGAEFEANVLPGEILTISPLTGLKKKQAVTSKHKATCQFEYTFFARPDSVIDDISVAAVRLKLGENLAQGDDIPSENAIVVPIPDSGRLSAMGYANASGMIYMEGLMKNRYIWRSKRFVKNKLNPLKTIVKDKVVILVDDSIISGNTLKNIIEMLRMAEPSSIHVRIACPPIINECEMNSSFAKRSRLIAFQKKMEHYENFNEEMRKHIDADSLKYQTIDGLKSAIGLNEEKICLSCLTEYCLYSDEKESQDLNILI